MSICFFNGAVCYVVVVHGQNVRVISLCMIRNCKPSLLRSLCHDIKIWKHESFVCDFKPVPMK